MKAIIKTNKNEADICFPCSRMQLAGALSYVGLDHKSPYQIPVNSISNFGCEVQLYPETQLDEWLLPVIKDESLEWVNSAFEDYYNLSYTKRLEVERKIGDDGIETLRDFQNIMSVEMAKIIQCNFYCPVVCEVFSENCWGDYDDDSAEENGEFAARYDDIICSKLREYTARDIENMAEYFHGHNGVSSKLISADWDFTTQNGCLYGKITCNLTDSLNENEEKALKDWIIGQNSDGLGEGFEQQEIFVDGDYRNIKMYVSLWHSGDDYFVDNEDEFDYRLNQGQGMSEYQ